MEIEPKVSVCVITYNHGEWLRECLQSIVDQITDFDYEVIVGDDCSTDGITREVLKEFAVTYPTKIVPLLREANMGGGGTQNWLDVMRRARGRYLAHIDGDDRMLPGKLQKQADFLDRHEECAFVAHDLRTFDSTTGETLPSSFGVKQIPEITDIQYLLIHRCFFGHSSKMFRRSSMITRERDKPTVDFFMHVEHATGGKIGYIHEALGEYRKSSQSATNAVGGAFQAVIDGYKDAYQRASDLGANSFIVERGYLLFRYSLARQFLRALDKKKFSEYIYLEANKRRYATTKHMLLAFLAFCPRLLNVLISLGRSFSKVRSMCVFKVKKVAHGK